MYASSSSSPSDETFSIDAESGMDGGGMDVGGDEGQCGGALQT